MYVPACECVVGTGYDFLLRDLLQYNNTRHNRITRNNTSPPTTPAMIGMGTPLLELFSVETIFD